MALEYVYAAMLLHSAGKEITESALENVLQAAGIEPDSVRIKALVAALSEIDIDEALKAPLVTAAVPAAAPEKAEEEEEKPEEKAEEEKEEEEEDLQGLSALFG